MVRDGDSRAPDGPVDHDPIPKAPDVKLHDHKQPKIIHQRVIQQAVAAADDDNQRP